jgi:hypothetical protein
VPNPPSSFFSIVKSPRGLLTSALCCLQRTFSFCTLYYTVTSLGFLKSLLEILSSFDSCVNRKMASPFRLRKLSRNIYIVDVAEIMPLSNPAFLCVAQFRLVCKYIANHCCCIVNNTYNSRLQAIACISSEGIVCKLIYNGACEYTT